MGNCFDNNRYSVSSSLCEKKGPDGVRVKLKSRSPQKRLKSNGLEKLFFSDEILDKETDS
jgi:hypothetical protein